MVDNLQGTLLKSYKLEERIGNGGFGAVYRAKQPTIGREVAVKIILPGYANNADFIRRFESEAHLIARLEHPHITPLHDFWRDPDGAYLVMRYLKGGSVRDALQDGSFELSAVSQLLDQIASALDFAHRNNVIHRDIKPGNILLDEDGNAYLADFGIAKDLAGLTDNKTAADAVVGSLDYISPEQARSEPVTSRTDIYSLGVTLYEMITGIHPFQNTSSIERLYKHINDPLPLIEKLDPAVQDEINAIIQRATAKDPAHRYPDVLALAAAFREGVRRVVTPTEQNIVEQLTYREQEILQCIADGLSNKEIANNLFISEPTVKWHVRQVYRKLGVRSRVQAVIRARELDLIVSGERDANERVSGVTTSMTGLPEPENPYKGLLAFQPADHMDFFGREELIDKLVGRMAENHALGRFLAVIGPSGSGKSSFVKAGLIPALWAGKLPGSEKWFVVDMLPGAHPLDELEVALTRLAANQAGNLREQLTRDERGLLRAAGLILPGDGSELVLIVDQFEELFTLVNNDDERIQFMNLLRTAVTETRSRVRVVITLRADFYDRPLRYPEFGELVRQRMETLLPLTAKGLERAITGPAERVGIRLEEGLVATIVGEMNYQAGALPLLQYALTELFERRDGRRLTNQAYHEIGGAVGALAKRADEVYLSLDAVGQEFTRQMFLRLVTLG
ncbi:MAG: protein kinase, partial [Anaerolineae bacterium]|nr:protein kinase [Anaerolineae bacterium]